MIGYPWNDEACLLPLHAQAREVAVTDVVKEFASKVGSLENLIEHIRQLPHRLDYGRDGPRMACGDTPQSQRLRLMPEDPNCFERTLWYLAVAEVLDPNGLRSSATIRTELGLHTFPIEESQR